VDEEKSLREQLAITEFVNAVLAGTTSAADLNSLLKNCTEQMVKYLNAACARIWLVNQSTGKLELRASSGLSTTSGSSCVSSVPDDFEIAVILRKHLPHLSNDVLNDPQVPDRDWASRMNLRSFAGYPLKRDDEVIGAMSMFASSPLSRATMNALSAVASSIVFGIDRIRSKRELEFSRRRFEQIVEMAPNGIIMVDSTGTMLLLNRRVEEIFHYSRGEMLGESIDVLVPERFRGRHSQQIKEFFADPQARFMGSGRDLSGRCKDGSDLAIEIGLSPVETEKGLCVLVSLVDITQRKLAEQRVSEFYSTVSHELRTPLTSIRGALGLLAGNKAGELPPKAARLVEVARIETERLVRLINDILDLRKLESGKMELRKENCLSTELVESTRESLAEMAADYNVAMTVSEDAIATVYCDRDRIIQSLINLVGNAIKFSGGEAVVTIKTSLSSGDFFRFEITDNGPGIAREDMHKLFGRFQQIDQSDSRARGGTGLGLAITRAIVEEHDGHIGVETEPSKGSTFWFELPCKNSWQDG
jgi:PAS domain S-box-containing protein